MKRGFDIIVSVLGLLALAPLLAVTALLIRVGSRGPVFFTQERIGRNFRPFRIYKFRTMIPDAPRLGPALTVGDDPRITRVGRFLRKTKLDELPQLINVLIGDMSFVGPRPEVRRYVEMFPREFENILVIRPGITDLASLRFRHESEVLAQAADPEAEYCQRILPEKMRLAREYIQHSSLLFDVSLILKTVLAMFRFSSPVRDS